MTREHLVEVVSSLDAPFKFSFNGMTKCFGTEDQVYEVQPQYGEVPVLDRSGKPKIDGRTGKPATRRVIVSRHPVPVRKPRKGERPNTLLLPLSLANYVTHDPGCVSVHGGKIRIADHELRSVTEEIAKRRKELDELERSISGAEDRERLASAEDEIAQLRAELAEAKRASAPKGK